MESHKNEKEKFDAFEELGRLLVEIRDQEIRICDNTLTHKYPLDTDLAGRWRKVCDEAGYEALIAMIIPDIVDHTIAGILYAIDQGALRLLYTVKENGKKIDLSEEGKGMLVRFYKSKGGWISRYSKERVTSELDLSRNRNEQAEP